MGRGVFSGILWGSVFSILLLWVAAQLGGMIDILAGPPTNIADQAPAESAPPRDEGTQEAPEVPTADALPETNPSRQIAELGEEGTQPVVDKAPTGETEAAAVPQAETTGTPQPPTAPVGAAPEVDTQGDAPAVVQPQAGAPTQPQTEAAPRIAATNMRPDAPQDVQPEPAAPVDEASQTLRPQSDGQPLLAGDPAQPAQPAGESLPEVDFSQPVIVEPAAPAAPEAEAPATPEVQSDIQGETPVEEPVEPAPAPAPEPEQPPQTEIAALPETAQAPEPPVAPKEVAPRVDETAPAADAPEVQAPEIQAPEVQAPATQAPEGQAPAGQETEGQATEGQETEEPAATGDLPAVVTPAPPVRTPDSKNPEEAPPEDGATDSDTPAVVMPGSKSPGGFGGQEGDIPVLKPGSGSSNLAPKVKVNRLPSIGGGTTQTEPDAAQPDPDRADDVPAIVKYAVPFENPEGRPLMAIVLLDDPSAPDTNDADLPFPVTFAVDASSKEAPARMRRFREAGYEVVAVTPLPSGARPQDAEVALQTYLSAVPEAVAIMDTPEAVFQSGRSLATQITEVLAETGHGMITYSRGLNSGTQIAEREGVPAAIVFREFDKAGQDGAAIKRFLDQAAFRAAQQPGVIMVGHNRPETIAALLEWRLGNRASTVALAPVSAVLLNR